MQYTPALAILQLISMAMFLKNVPIVILFILFAFIAQATDIDKTIIVNGLKRQYLVHLPPGYTAAKQLPVIFALHGGGGEYKGTPKQYNLNAPADKFNFILVYPNALKKSWSMKGVSSRVRGGGSEDIDDVHFISVLMDTLVRYYKADDKRFFCTGISRGGIFSLYLAQHLSSRIKAIAPVCASIPLSISDNYSFGHPMPVLMINGTADPLILYNGGEGRFTPDNNGVQFNMLPTEQLVKKIVGLNGCNAQATVYNIPDADPSDGCTAAKYSYTGPNADIIFIKITGGGHTWAGGPQYLPKFIIGKVCRDFKAEDEIFSFFMSLK